MNILKKRQRFVSILAVLALVLTLSPASAFASTKVSDIADHWAEDEIQSWVDSGYIKGYPDGTFKPENHITRAEFMTVVNSAFGYTEKAKIDYTDVEEGKWYTEAVAIAKAAGYINGYPDGTMKPNAKITRQEAAVMIGKINELKADAAAADKFDDGKAIPAWSKGAIGACVTAKILSGYPDGTFLANNHIKRGESVIALSKALDYHNAPDAVAMTVNEVDTEGFKLALNPSVDGITKGAVTLTKVDNETTGEAINITVEAINVTVEAITTTDSGETYAVSAALEDGKTYTLKLNVEGYDFGKGIQFTVSTDQAAANEVNERIEALPATDALTIDDAEAVQEATAAYDALTEAQKALISESNLTKLNSAVSKMETLTAGENAGETEDSNNTGDTGSTSGDGTSGSAIDVPAQA